MNNEILKLILNYIVKQKDNKNGYIEIREILNHNIVEFTYKSNDFGNIDFILDFNNDLINPEFEMEDYGYDTIYDEVFNIMYHDEQYFIDKFNVKSIKELLDQVNKSVDEDESRGIDFLDQDNFYDVVYNECRDYVWQHYEDGKWLYNSVFKLDFTSIIEEKIVELENEIKYEKDKMKISAYGKSDILYVNGLEENLEYLNSLL